MRVAPHPGKRRPGDRAPSPIGAVEPTSDSTPSLQRKDVPGRGNKAAVTKAPVTAAIVAGVRITHPERVLYAAAGITKVDIARYYEQIAPALLEHIRGRPVSLVRCPQGPASPCFFQKHGTAKDFPGIDTVMIEESGGRKPYFIVNNVRALVALTQMNTIELHTWGACAKSLERPDRMILDLDPDASLSWPSVVDAAHFVRHLLDEIRMVSFLRTTGGKGLHIVAPLQRRHHWEEVKRFGKAIALRLVARHPDQFVANVSKTERAGKIYVDWLRNGRGATAIASWSVRARENPAVACPISWEELDVKTPPASFDMRAALERTAQVPDPWAGYEDARQRITSRMFHILEAA